MRVLVCGGREFKDEEFLRENLNRLHEKYKFTHLVHGAARGADTMADTWARQQENVTCEPDPISPLEWKHYRSGAGPRRNQRMLDTKPDLVVAFGGETGTADMVRRSRAAGVHVIEFNIYGEEI